MVSGKSIGRAWYLTSFLPRNRLDRALVRLTRAITEPSAVAPDPKFNMALKMLNTQVDSSIRRYRARFCIALGSVLH
jgi:hypothetical protein